MGTPLLRLAGLVVGTAFVVLLTGSALVGLGVDPAGAVRTLADPTTWRSGDPTAALLPVLALAAWGCTFWLAAGVLLSALGTLPGALGRTADAVARRVTPAAVRRLGRLAVGATLVTGAVAGALPASAATGPGAASTASAASWTDLDWPGAPTTPATAAAEATHAAPLPPAGPSAAPAPAPTPTAATDLAAFGSTEREAPAPAAAPDRSDPSTAAAAEVVVVRGDTLWSLASRSLGVGATDQQVADEWQRWYAANRAVIGDDPDLLLPGQRLLPPSP